MADSTRHLAPALRALLASARQDTDAALLGRFVSARDEPAFDELMRRHGPMVLGVSRRVTRDAHAAEDVFQATFLLLARRAESIRRAEGLGAWLHRTAFRLALRSRKVGQAVESTRPRPSAEPSPLDALTARELIAILDEELARLPGECRAAVVLCGLEGLSLEEAARRLGWTTGSVKGRLERGRARLRQRLEERGLTLPGAMVAPLLDAGSCGSLMQATRAVVFEGKATASVLALVEGGVSAMGLTTVSLVSAMLLSCVLLALGATVPVDPPPERAATPPAAAFADPLPDGARLRLGAMERRAVATRLAVTADGKSILGLPRAGERLTEWDFGTGKLRRHRAVPNPMREAWVLSPDGRWFATSEAGERPGQVRLVVRDVRTTKPVRKLPVKGAYAVGNAAFSRDGRRLAAVGLEARKRRVLVWDWQNGEELLAAEVDGQGRCHQVALSPDGKHVLVLPSLNGANDGIYCWDVAARKMSWTTNWKYTEQVVVTPRGKVISAERQKALVERDLLTGAITNTLPLPPGRGMPYLALTPDGNTLIESGREGVVVWDLTSGKRLRTLPGPWSEVIVAPDGRSVVTNDGSLQRWDLTTGKPLYPDESHEGHLGEVRTVIFSAGGTRLVSGALDGAVGVWDAQTGRPIHLCRGHPACRSYPLGYGSTHGGVKSLDVTPDGRRAVSVSSVGQIRVWDVEAGKEARSFPPFAEGGISSRNEYVYSPRLDRDGRGATGFVGPGFRPAGAELTGRLMRWDVETGTRTDVCAVPKFTPFTVALEPAGRWFVSAGRLFDARTGHALGALEGSDADYPPHAVFSPDGLLVAGGPSWDSWDQRPGPPKGPMIRVWEAATGKVIAQLDDTRWLGDKVFYPGGRFLAANDARGIRLWDLRTEKEVKYWLVPEDAGVSSFAFSPDGKTLATGHLDGTILLWDVNLPAEKPNPRRPGELESLWKQLGDDDVRKAYRAAWRLAELPGEAVPFLRERLKPARAASAEVTRPLILGLDDDQQARRDEAARRLRELGHQAESALREALKAPASAEQKRRLQQLLGTLEKQPSPTAEQRRDLRAVLVLGWLGTAEARKLLGALAEGNAFDPVTRQATASLVRGR